MMRRRDLIGLGAAALASPGLFGSERAGKSCILLMLTGGPSQLDTWDPKPDAPSGIRSPFRPIRTNVPGIEISEIFPRMARHADKFALIRSCYYDGPALHETGNFVMQTGRPAVDVGLAVPSLGTIAAGYWQAPHVTLPCPESHGEFGLTRETDDTRRRYGFTSFGQSCLMARQLVEAGTRFVTVNMSRSVFDESTWDSHGMKPFSTIADYPDRVAPVFDQAYSALLDDLQARGLLGATLVAGLGEFGRSPRINPAGGRDHWAQCFTVHLAGGGIRGGQVYGSSDAIGAEPKDNPVSPAMLVATMRQVLELPAESPGSGASPIRALCA